MSEPAFLLTSDESAIVMREHEGRWYAVRLTRGQYGTFEYLDQFASLRAQRFDYRHEWEPINRGPFIDSSFYSFNPTLNDYGVSRLLTDL